MLRKNLNLVIVFVLLVLQGTLSPGRVNAAPTLTATATSSVASLAAGGTVVAWGCGDGYDSGQCTVPAGLSDVTAIAAGGDFNGRSHSLALKSDGTVVAWGDNSYGQAAVPAGLSGVTAISAGALHSLALKSDGTVVAWGFNGDGEATVPGGLTGVISIAAGGWHSMALKSDGTVVAWGRGDEGQTSVPAGLTGVTAIAAGWWHGLALKSDGTVVAWGCGIYQDWGQCTVPTGLSGVTAIAAGGWNGGSHSLALKGDGTVVAWGDNHYGQAAVPAGLIWVTAIAAGFGHSLALKADGTVVAWGCQGLDFGQCRVPVGLTGVAAIAAGGYHSLALVSSPSDITPPAITISTPADSTSYLLGQLVNANYACQDEDGGSGLASCDGTVVNGSLIETSSIGAKTFTVDALDNAGNPASLTHHYNVIYNFSGFFQPVDNLPTLNSVKGGAGVAVKFRLGGDQALNVLASGYPLSWLINCDGSMPVDAIEETVTVSNSGLTYDAATGTYVYNWKTERAWAGTCRQLIVKLADGTEHKANFKFK